MITKIVSGGQTGVDRAGLDWAISNGLTHGGWCPKGRIAEDGVIDSKYQLLEMDHGSYRQRTKQNVLDSDGTLIINIGALEGGTLATVKFTKQFSKPAYLLQLDVDIVSEIEEVNNWLQINNIATLNIAGPRESKRLGIYAMTLTFMTHLNIVPKA